ncbi:MAG: hypothetical protein KA764_05290 [Anaerolineales bacterium]|nr:hypothetical protein [Anaerolineales bacterium]
MTALISVTIITALTAIVTFLIWIWTMGLKNEANAAMAVSWSSIPVGRIGVDGIYFSLIILGMALLRAEVIPRWCGLAVIFGTALQMPSQFASDYLQTSIFLWFPPLGSAVSGAALIWIGWRLLSGRAWTGSSWAPTT